MESKTLSYTPICGNTNPWRDRLTEGRGRNTRVIQQNSGGRIPTGENHLREIGLYRRILNNAVSEKGNTTFFTWFLETRRLRRERVRENTILSQVLHQKPSRVLHLTGTRARYISVLRMFWVGDVRSCFEPPCKALMYAAIMEVCVGRI